MTTLVLLSSSTPLPFFLKVVRVNHYGLGVLHCGDLGLLEGVVSVDHLRGSFRAFATDPGRQHLPGESRHTGQCGDEYEVQMPRWSFDESVREARSEMRMLVTGEGSWPGGTGPCARWNGLREDDGEAEDDERRRCDG